MKPTTVDEYIDGFTANQKARLAELRHVLRLALPNATEALKWGNPAVVDTDGMILAIYGGYKDHINFVVTPSAKQAFEQKLAAYKTGKGSVQLSYDKPLPAQLIAEMITYRLDEYHDQGVKWM